jgi:integrase
MKVDNGQEENPQLTFDEFLDNHYERHARFTYSSPDGTMGYLRRFGFGDKKLDEIRLADLKNWQIDRQELNRSPKTINREVATIKSALQYAVDSDLLDNHPLKKLKPLKIDTNSEPRYLSVDEEKQLISALVARDRRKREQRLSYNEHQKVRGYNTLPKIGTYSDNLTPLVMLAINTGLRRGELWNLVRSDIDMKLKKLTVRELLGHASLEMTLRYAHLAPKTLQDAVDMI